MLSLVIATLRSLTAGFHARRNLVLENLALRHQLLVLNRTVKAPSPQFRPSFLGSPLRDVGEVDEGSGPKLLNICRQVLLQLSRISAVWETSQRTVAKTV